jgi:hypothetical protein
MPNKGRKMGYQLTKDKKVKRTVFPKKLTKAQIQQMDNAKSNTDTVNRAIAATKRINFYKTIKSV